MAHLIMWREASIVLANKDRSTKSISPEMQQRLKRQKKITGQIMFSSEVCCVECILGLAGKGTGLLQERERDDDLEEYASER